jgi:hypothetical protein
MKKLSSTGLNWMQVTAKRLIAKKQINYDAALFFQKKNV